MGNTQSHNKLSKPKTNTNSPFVLPKIDKVEEPDKTEDPSSFSSRYTDVTLKEKGPVVELRRNLKPLLTSPADTDYTFCSDEDDDIGELACHVQRRLSTLSRSNSLRSPTASVNGSTARLSSLPGSKLSVATETLQVDVETAITILKEVRKNASPEDLAALHKALRSSERDPSPSSQGLDRKLSTANRNRSSQSLIRRRSLATPGVATRGSPVDANRNTWSHLSTAQSAIQDQEWRADMMGSSPLTRLASLNIAEDGRDSPTPRAKTPGDMDYAHLGSLKVGSLYVTNGAPSPAPSALSKLAARGGPGADAPQEEDYFTASEGCSSPTPRLGSRKPRAHRRSKSSILPQSYQQKRSARNWSPGGLEKRMSRCDSPLKIEAQARELLGDDLDEESIKLRLHVVNKSAETLARDYRASIPTSPFADEEGFNPREVAPAQLRSETVVDEAYDETLPANALSYREEAYRLLDGTMFGDGQSSTDDSLSSNQRPAPSKADSGYSSGESSLASRPSEDASKEDTSPNVSQEASRFADKKKSGKAANGQGPSPLNSFKEVLSLSVPRPLPPIPTHESVAGKPAHLQTEGALGGRMLLPSAPSTPKSVSSQLSTESKPSTQRKLQKRRPSSQNLPVVQSCRPIPEGSIPDVPKSVRSKFTRRLSEAPGMEYLTQTSSPARDEVEEAPNDTPLCLPLPLSSQSPSTSTRPRNPRRSQTERPRSSSRHSLRRSLSFFRGKNKEEKAEYMHEEEEEEDADTVDLGAAASALGSSPYDAAMPLRARAVISPTYPHQLGAALPRAQSMVALDAKAAAELARLQSRDRAARRPQMPPRPRSYHDCYIDRANGSPLQRALLRGYEDVPAVPEVDPRRLSAISSSRSVSEDDGSFPTLNRVGIRTRPTGRGAAVSQLIDKYDKRYQPSQPAVPPEWEHHSRLWSQRRKSMAEGLREQARESAADRALSLPPEDTVVDRYGGGLDYGYERGFGVGGSAGTRQARSAASRKSMHFSSAYGVDLSDVPVMVQRGEVRG